MHAEASGSSETSVLPSPSPSEVRLGSSSFTWVCLAFFGTFPLCSRDRYPQEMSWEFSLRGVGGRFS